MKIFGEEILLNGHIEIKIPLLVVRHGKLFDPKKQIMKIDEEVKEFKKELKDNNYIFSIAAGMEGLDIATAVMTLIHNMAPDKECIKLIEEKFNEKMMGRF